MPIKRAILIGVALALLISITPNRGTFPSTTDLIALQRARQIGDDLTEWTILAKWVSSKPSNARIWERMAFLDQRGGLCDQSIREFKMAASLGKLADSSLVPFTQCLLETKQFNSIIDLLDPKLTSDNVLSSDLYEILAKAYLGSAQLEPAIAITATWSTNHPESGVALFNHALYLALAHPDQAISLLQTAANQDPVYGSAEIAMQTAINKGSLSDDKAYRMLELGRAYGSLEEWELAEYAFQQACQTNPLYAEAFAFLGEARQHLGGTGNAEFQTALSLDPDSILVQALNALRLQRQGQVELAIDALKAVTVQEPDNPHWLISLAQAQAISGDLASALDSYQDAIATDPENPQAWQALAEFSLSYQYEVNSVGIPAAEQALYLAPGDAVSLDLICQAEMIQDDLPNAEIHCREAIQIDLSYAPAHHHLALILLQMARPEEAIAELKIAYSMGSREAESLLNQLYSDE